MNSNIIRHIIRFVGLLLVQVFILKNIYFPSSFLSHVVLLLYPIYIFLLPTNIPRPLLLLVAFFLGLGVDIFYDSVGVHAATSVFIAFIRMYVLRILEPVQGYKTEGSLSASNYGMVWFSSYAAILLFIHCLVFFSISAFSFVFIIDILIKTMLSFVFSFILIILHQVILKVP